MLGRYVTSYLKHRYEVVPITRRKFDISVDLGLWEFFKRHNVIEGDVIINCAGVIKQREKQTNTLESILVNSIFPHRLSYVCENFNVKMIHITTDCVFSGKKGSYSEDDLHDCLDAYGKTKSLGEPENCTIIRTSIIGEEIENKVSLVEWFKSKRDDQADGYNNHLWNGVTCLQLAKIIDIIITNNLFWDGVRHIFTKHHISKFELLKIINDVYELNVRLNEISCFNSVNRTLRSNFEMDFDIPSLDQQINELFHYRKFL